MKEFSSNMSRVFYNNLKKTCNADVWLNVHGGGGDLTYKPADSCSFYYWNQKFLKWIQKTSFLVLKYTQLKLYLLHSSKSIKTPLTYQKTSHFKSTYSFLADQLKM